MVDVSEAVCGKKGVYIKHEAGCSVSLVACDGCVIRYGSVVNKRNAVVLSVLSDRDGDKIVVVIYVCRSPFFCVGRSYLSPDKL